MALSGNLPRQAFWEICAQLLLSRNYMNLSRPRFVPSRDRQSRMPRLTAASAGLFLLASSFCASNARAYIAEGASWPAGSTVVFQMALGNAGRTLSDGNTSWDSAANPAPDNWNAQMQGLHFSTVVNPSAPLSSGDRINTIAFSSTVFGQSFGSSTLAVTYYRYSGGTMSEADVLFNNHQTFDSYRGPLRFGGSGYAIADIRRVLIHELGHALGLDHPDQHGQRVDAIMNSLISNRETVSPDDISGAQSLYGAPGGSPTQPTMSLSVSPASARTGGSATYTVTASLIDPASAVTVNYRMSGTAVLGTHYSLSGTPGSVTIPAGASSADVTLTVLKGPRKTKRAAMTLTSGSGYTVSASSTATVTISR
jgi:hypothetical protein